MCFKKLFVFIFWLCWVFFALSVLSLISMSGDSSSLRCAGCWVGWLFLLCSTGSRAHGPQQLLLTVLVAMGFGALWHVGSSQARLNPASVPFIGRWTPVHCSTREFQMRLLKGTRSCFAKCVILLNGGFSRRAFDYLSVFNRHFIDCLLTGIIYYGVYKNEEAYGFFSSRLSCWDR